MIGGALTSGPVHERFNDAALVLVAHGSSTNADSAMPTYRHAAALRARGLFAEVREAFWKQPPFIRDVVRQISTPRVFVVPLFIGEGYFTQEIIPRELGLPATSLLGFPRILRRPGQTLGYGGPVGTHPSLTEVLLARARDIVRQHPAAGPVEPAEVTLFLAGHGTGQNDHSRRAIERQVHRMRERALYAGVHAVFLLEDPRIGDCYRLATTRNLVIVPCFISDGLHTAEDIPVLLGATAEVVRARRQRGEWPWPNPSEQQGCRVWYTPSLGSAPHLPEVILERVREAAQAAAQSD
jgi:sirohydrochlorin cobaltochelatase